jgi:murein DD-endopeptidase MepM/ murein hydrolase activator NlpD
MTHVLKAASILLVFGVGLILTVSAHEWFLPVNYPLRQSTDNVRLTKIGAFGLVRIARPTVPSHLHTGVDIMRPGSNYVNEAIYAASDGIVISMRDDGPYAQVIVEHVDSTDTLWTVYEHLAGIRVIPGCKVTPTDTLGRFMNQQELIKYGYKFDHVHFEIMKKQPQSRSSTAALPHRLFQTYALTCYTQAQLLSIYEDPLKFLKKRFRLQ